MPSVFWYHVHSAFILVMMKKWSQRLETFCIRLYLTRRIQKCGLENRSWSILEAKIAPLGQASENQHLEWFLDKMLLIWSGYSIREHIPVDNTKTYLIYISLMSREIWRLAMFFWPYYIWLERSWPQDHDQLRASRKFWGWSPLEAKQVFSLNFGAKIKSILD